MTQITASQRGGNSRRGQSARMNFSGWPDSLRTRLVALGGVRTVADLANRGPRDFRKSQFAQVWADQAGKCLGALGGLGAAGSQPLPERPGALRPTQAGCALPRSSDCDPAQSRPASWARKLLGLGRGYQANAFRRADAGGLRSFAWSGAGNITQEIPARGKFGPSRKHAASKIADVPISKFVSGRDQDEAGWSQGLVDNGGQGGLQVCSDQGAPFTFPARPVRASGDQQPESGECSSAAAVPAVTVDAIVQSLVGVASDEVLALGVHGPRSTRTVMGFCLADGELTQSRLRRG